MCGLLFTNDPQATADAFRGALALMQHRGPDVVGSYAMVAGGAQLGHNRLKILDLDDRSNQPFCSRDGRYAIIYNGEVYNFRELAAQLDIPLRTTSDTEVLLELFAREGPAMLTRLNGMFAFVVVNRLTGELFAARDRLGIKPLYMRRQGDRWSLSSEIRPLVELGGGATVDPVGVRQYRTLRTFFNGRTLYRDISMFPAGHYLHGGRFHRYWELPEGPQAAPEDDELMSLLASAVELRMIADVPVGSYLSGGLDSTVLVALSGCQDTWVVGMPENNEFAWARSAAEHLGSRHHEVEVTPEQYRRLLDQIVLGRAEPVSVPNEVLLYLLSAQARQHDTVLLSGEGADELFLGYDRIFRWAAAAPTWDLREFSRHYAYGSQPDLAVVEDAVAPFMGRRNPLAIVSAFFQVAHLHGLLRRLDAATMAASVEARNPFVDFRLVERLAGVPVTYCMKDGVVKAPLKRLFAHRIPAPIIAREKLGFPVDLAAILPDGRPGQTTMDRFLDHNLRLCGIDPAADPTEARA